MDPLDVQREDVAPEIITVGTLRHNRAEPGPIPTTRP